MEDYIIIIIIYTRDMDLILNVKSFTYKEIKCQIFSIFISLLSGEKNCLVYLESNTDNLRAVRYL